MYALRKKPRCFKYVLKNLTFSPQRILLVIRGPITHPRGFVNATGLASPCLPPFITLLNVFHMLATVLTQSCGDRSGYVRLHASNSRCHCGISTTSSSLVFFFLSFFWSSVLTSSLPGVVQTLYSYASNTRLHTSQQDVSDSLHLCLQVLCPFCPSFPHHCSSAISTTHLAQQPPEEEWESQYAHLFSPRAVQYVWATTGGSIVPPSSAVPHTSSFVCELLR